MSKYVTIGLATQYAFNKIKAKDAFGSVDAAKEYVRKRYAPSSLYACREDEETVWYLIYGDILEKELVDFLKEFYAFRFSDPRDEYRQTNETLDAIAKLHSADEILKLAKSKECYCFQWNGDWANILVSTENGNILPVTPYGIDLSIDGKILMDIPRNLFDFITLLMQIQFDKHSLADTLHITITI